eukprot:GHVH01004140.1.p1 GENE.GHVH01004140.1~~GHVH01004140.1.p1  ORF type:complete len:448 (+),score=38.99 GHVH01004140.1:143-1486(+)
MVVSPVARGRMKRGYKSVPRANRHLDGQPRLHDFRPPQEDGNPRETEGSKWCVKECCGIFTVLFVYFFVVWPVYFIGFVLTSSWHLGARIPVNLLTLVFAIGALCSHTKCMITNPGTVPLRCMSVGYPMPDETLLSEAEGMRFCYKCDGPKPPRAHHCSTCGRCILKMDHHCPWMNNCIGMFNLKYFMLFLGYVSLMSGTAISSIAATFLVCSNSSSDKNALRGYAQTGISDLFARSDPPSFAQINNSSRQLRDADDILLDLERFDTLEEDPVISSTKPNKRRNSRIAKRQRTRTDIPDNICGLKPHNLLFTILLGLESLLFGIFTTVMLIDAFQMAASGDSQIDDLKKNSESYPHQKKVEDMRNNEERTFKLGMREFCGSKFSIRWFLPVRGYDEEYYRGLTDCDRYVLSTTYWDRYVVPRNRSVMCIELGNEINTWNEVTNDAIS